MPYDKNTDRGQALPEDYSEKKHKRRHHYSGKYPRRFEDKYKELQPEKYEDTIEKVISKGNTPAGMHIPIMVDEILETLDIQPGQVGLDCTLGYGGHTSKFLEKLDGKGHLYSLDADPIEIKKTEQRLREKGYGEDIFTPININFAYIDQVAKQYGPFDFVLADLGVSSMQIDNPERGFSYKTDGPLDLRFNPKKGESAAQRLSDLDASELAGMFYDNSDEPYAEEIAKAIKKKLYHKEPIETTFDLRQTITDTLKEQPDLAHVSKKDFEEAVKKSCARVFQALRIDVNSEFEVLYTFLDKLPDILKEGGKAAILTFHSGEDRLVKKSFKEKKKAGLYSEISRDMIRPSKEECYRNPRAHSTKMRWAIK
ncbi:MAG: 16S rRNA (cytosine(1402)-N(4))-methyltransferase RsmH [Lachnospiraceae bacterium]|nr:16S rRNA (cytosine(1402)-N(4))-methyltransferase RsmH [Lachnospiraceae bacterium]